MHVWTFAAAWDAAPSTVLQASATDHLEMRVCRDTYNSYDCSTKSTFLPGTLLSTSQQQIAKATRKQQHSDDCRLMLVKSEVYNTSLHKNDGCVLTFSPSIPSTNLHAIVCNRVAYTPIDSVPCTP